MTCPFHVLPRLPPTLQRLDICMGPDARLDAAALEALGNSLSHLNGHLKRLRLLPHDRRESIETEPDAAQHLVRCLPDSLEKLELSAEFLASVDPGPTAALGRRLSKLRKLVVAFILSDEGLASALSLCQHGARPIRCLVLDVDYRYLPTIPQSQVSSLRHLSLRVRNHAGQLLQDENKLMQGVEHLSSLVPTEIQSVQVKLNGFCALPPLRAPLELCKFLGEGLRRHLPQTCSCVVREGQF